jgi:hypothetical protein
LEAKKAMSDYKKPRRSLKRNLMEQHQSPAAPSASTTPDSGASWLTESYTGSTAFVILEERQGKLKVRGEFARPDVPTANKRVYGLNLWEKEIARVRPLLAQRKVVGELDHPDDGKLRLQRASHLITDLRVEYQNGVPIVVGEAEILENTDQGRQLAALIRHGVQVGVSSRGQGSVIADGRGNDIVQNDFRLVTFDFVADPADIHAYPQVMEAKEGASSSQDLHGIQEFLNEHESDTAPVLFEGVEMGTVDHDLTETSVSNAGLSESQIVDIENFGAVLQKALNRVRFTLEDEVRNTISEEVHKMKSAQVSTPEGFSMASHEENNFSEGVMSNNTAQNTDANQGAITESAGKQPSLSEAMKAISALQTEVKALQEKNQRLARASRDIAYSNLLENHIADHPFAEDIRDQVGDLSQYHSLAELQEAIAESESMLQEAYEDHLAEEKEHKRMVNRMQESQQVLREENDRLREGLEKAVLAANKLGVQLYVERRISRFSDPPGHHGGGA